MSVDGEFTDEEVFGTGQAAPPAREFSDAEVFGPQPRTTAQEAGRQVGLTYRSAQRGLAGLVDIPLNAAAAVVNAGPAIWDLARGNAPGTSEPFGYNNMRRGMDAALDRTGVPTPAPGLESLVGAGVEAVSQTGPFSLGAAAPNALMRLFAARTGGEVALNAGAGMGGHIGAQAAPEGWEMVGGLAGGLAGAGAPAAATAGARAGTNALTRYAQPFTRSGQETIAANRLAEAATDLPAVRERLADGPDQIVPGSMPTTAQQTGDLGLLRLERGVALRNSEPFGERMADQNSARRAALDGLQEGGDATAARDLFRRQLTELEAASAAEVGAARAAADQAGAGLGGRETAETYGAALRAPAREAETAARAAEGALWDVIDPSGQVVIPATSLRQAAADILAEQTPSAAPLSAAEQQIFEVARGYGDAVPFRELVQLRQYANSAIAAEAPARTPAYARLSRFKAALDNALDGAVEQQVVGGDAGLVERLRAASAATRERARTFGNAGGNPMGAILRTQGGPDNFQMPNSAVPAEIFQGGPGGAERVRAYRQAVGDEQALPALADVAAMRLRQYAARPDGTLDPAKVARFQQQHGPAMEAFPDLAQRFSSVAAAEDVVVQAIRRGEEATTAFNRSAAARLMNAEAEEIAGRVGSILRADNSVTQFRDLARRVGSDDAARQGIRRAVADYISTTLVNNVDVAARGEAGIRADQFQNFMRRNQPALRAFFTPAEVRSLVAVSEDLFRAARSQRGTQVTAGSPTVQNAFAAGAVEENILQRLARQNAMATAGATVGTVIGGWPGALVGGAVGRGADTLRAAGLARADDALARALLDPTYARLLLAKVTPQNEARLLEGLRRLALRSGSLGMMQGNHQERRAAPPPAGPMNALATMAYPGAGQAGTAGSPQNALVDLMQGAR